MPTIAGARSHGGWQSRLYRLAVPTLLVLASCSKNPPPDLPDPNSPDADVVFAVENRRSDDVVVELYRDGQKQRLGMVTAQNEQAFTLSWDRLVNTSRVVLAVHPIGTTLRYASENLVLRPGSQVELTVNQVLRQSTVSVY
jgi:hypothetical protein